MHVDFLHKQRSCLESRSLFDHPYGKCCNHLCISYMPSKLDNSCARICFLDSYLHLVAFELQKNMCFRIWIFQVQSQHTTLPLSYRICLSINMFSFWEPVFCPEKLKRTSEWHFDKIQFWNGHVASNYYLASVNPRSRLLKGWLFLCPDVNMNAPGLNFSWGFLCLCICVQRMCMGIKNCTYN